MTEYMLTDIGLIFSKVHSVNMILCSKNNIWTQKRRKPLAICLQTL